MEKLDFRLQSSQAKSIGTAVSVAGALTVTLYKGQPFTASQANQLLLLPSSNWILGGFLCAVASFFPALLYIVLTWILKDYPEELMVTSIACIFVTVLSAIISLIVDRDPNAWMLKPDVELIAILCSAVFAASFSNLVHAWACHKRGPLYTAMFKPLGMVIATFLGVSFLGDTLYAGSVVGGIIIAVGFYTVIWGKAQEEKMGEEGEGNSNLSQPLINSLF